MTFGRKLAEHQERRAADKQARMEALVAPSRSLHRGSYGGTTAEAAPKSEPYRDPVLLEMARGRPCLLMVPALCTFRVDTVVAAHSNHQKHGKGMGRKADDHYSVWACAACHQWLDTGKAAAPFKTVAWVAGHARQVMYWKLIAMDPKEPERFRRAARRALDHLDEIERGENTCPADTR